MRAHQAAARTATFIPPLMKWFLAGLGLCLAALVACLASIVFGYRQVIGRYIRGNQPGINTNEGRRVAD